MREVQEYLQGKEITKVTDNEKLQMIIEHIEGQVAYLGENTGIKEMRKHLSYYLKNLPNAASIRQRVNQIETKNELVGCLTEYFESL